MAGDQENPHFPTPAELKAMAAALKRRERAEKKRPRPENPVIVARNAAAKAFWSEKMRRFDAHAQTHPDDVADAVKEHGTRASGRFRRCSCRRYPR